MPKQLAISFFIVILLIGCGGNGNGGESSNGDEPVALPTAAVELAPDGSELGTPVPGSPRGDLGGDAGLPPTFTPAPQEVISGAPTSAARPGTPVITEDTRTYTVVAGDTLKEIADSFGVELDDLAQVNRFVIEDIDKIYPGQVLIIPDS